METIVVGMDGSEHSLAALRWAAEEAELRGAKVVAVHAWTAPQMATAYAGVNVPEIAFDTIRDAARELLEGAVEEAVPDARVEILRVVTEGEPAAALVAAAQEAALLVVGSRGRGGFKGLLLGSVSQQVAHHAPCPVVVVRMAVPATRDEQELVAAIRKER